jgi:hypothetical protein
MKPNPTGLILAIVFVVIGLTLSAMLLAQAY